MSSSIYQIEKLDGNNFDSWSIQMRSVLVHSGYWKLVSGELKAEDGTNEAEIAKIKSEDEKALATIFLSVKPSQLNYVKNCKFSHEAWKKLNEVYKPQGPIQKVTLYKKLLYLSMASDGDMVEYINLFTEITEKLEEIGISMQEELLSIILLSSLPQDYENFVIAMETRDSLPKLNSLKLKLLEEGERRKNEKEAVTNQQAFGIRARSERKNEKEERKYNNKPKFKGKCFTCGKVGHYANKCDVKKQKQHQQQQQHAFSVLAVADALQQNKWYVDSGATTHMCNDRNMFTTFQQHEEKLLLAGNKYIVARGIGDVNIKSCDSDVSLRNVLYCSELQANR